MAPVVGAKVPWTTARLVQEALDLGLHVVEDPMIKLLGRTKFVDLVVRGTVGWQEGVRTLRFSYTFKHACYLASLVSNVVYNASDMCVCLASGCGIDYFAKCCEDLNILAKCARGF
jgi:hypothetical protein